MTIVVIAVASAKQFHTWVMLWELIARKEIAMTWTILEFENFCSVVWVRRLFSLLLLPFLFLSPSDNNDAHGDICLFCGPTG